MDINIEALLTPISGTNPAGKDMFFSSEKDALKEARRSDDPALAQGEWETVLKKADWSKVETIALDVLTQKSKDIQFAVWLVEALTRLYQFEGLSQGLLAINRLLETYWDSLYPEIEDNDLSYRVGPLEWLNNNLPSVIYSLPLSSGTTLKCCWLDIEQAREVDNLGRKDPEAMKKAIEEGKLTQADVDKVIKETSDAFILKNYELLKDCLQNFADLDKTIDKLYVVKGSTPEQEDINVAPSLREISKAIDNVYGFIARIVKDRQIKTEPEPTGNDNPVNIEVKQTELDATVINSGNTVSEKQHTYTGGAIQTREDAVRVLAERSIYFKKSEPHSPIYFLLDRAVLWGNMPLDQWLHEMINEGWNDLPTLLRVIGANQESSKINFEQVDCTLGLTNSP